MCNRLLGEMAWQPALLLLPPYERLADKRSLDRMGTEELLLKKKQSGQLKGMLQNYH